MDSEATPEPETSEESPMEEVQEDTELEELVTEPPTVDAVSPEAAAPVAEAPVEPTTSKESLADSERSKFSFKSIFSGNFNFFNRRSSFTGRRSTSVTGGTTL